MKLVNHPRDDYMMNSKTIAEMPELTCSEFESINTEVIQGCMHSSLILGKCVTILHQLNSYLGDRVAFQGSGHILIHLPFLGLTPHVSTIVLPSRMLSFLNPYS